MKVKLTLFALLMICFSCTSNAQKKEPNLFNFKNYKTITGAPKTEKDSAIVFVNYILDNNYMEAEKLYPDMFKIDVSPYMNEGPGYEPYLGYAGEFIVDYTTSYSNMALAVFLENKYRAYDGVYDMLLRGSVNMDSTNLAAIFLLAKLRYENGITDDAYFLVQHMINQGPENKEVQKINAWFNKNHKPLSNNLPTLERFMKEEVFYHGDSQ
ncbi:hypothetical protein H8S95_07535 [Pontibacter sp. KCTC 32443]|uniref:hypothetical protein n=1 Tax=Pontibacter TaxID=323449 RepID=UPI00164D6A7A|nr:MULTISPECIES: hypothetical protein [Pontibacter]MBC5773911.1 hypothetical protein [Pontibacter sp. KCTC 32443]